MYTRRALVNQPTGSLRARPSHLWGAFSVELVIIKVIAAVALTGLAARVFIWEAAGIAAGFRQFRRQVGGGRKNSRRARQRSNV
jgi:hypothetical protein